MPTAPAAPSSRSPSPLPTTSSAPLPLTPGPRAAALADLYSKALAATLRSCSYANFAACFPTPATHTPRVLRAVWEQIHAKIAAKGASEFDAILAERNVVPGLNAWEAVVAEAKGRREADGDRRERENVPPHELPPDELLAVRLAPELANVQTQLERQLEEAESYNTALAGQIRDQRQEIERIINGLETTMRDVEGANDALAAAVLTRDQDGKTLRDGVRELHNELLQENVP